uniref:Uncharacterized protein n=1 Tax=Oryza nivara TaxID=4536 RepID=A0A0E0IN69_ORYNI
MAIIFRKSYVQTANRWLITPTLRQGLAMELKNALSTSSEASLLIKHMTYSITDASHGNVILPSSPAKPNSARDMVRRSPKTAVPRYGNGTSNRAPSAVYTAQWPLPARDDDAVLQQSSAATAFCPLPPADVILSCNFLAN